MPYFDSLGEAMAWQALSEEEQYELEKGAEKQKEMDAEAEAEMETQMAEVRRGKRQAVAELIDYWESEAGRAERIRRKTEFEKVKRQMEEKQKEERQKDEKEAEKEKKARTFN